MNSVTPRTSRRSQLPKPSPLNMTANAKSTLMLVLVAASAVIAESATCGFSSESGGCHDRKESLKLKFIAIASILATSMIGVCIPLVTRAIPALGPDRDAFVIVKAFASGVILATGYMHVMPDSFDDLRSDCLPENPWRKFPFTTFVAMLSAVATLMVDSFAMSFHKKHNMKSFGAPGGAIASNGSSKVEGDAVAVVENGGLNLDGEKKSIRKLNLSAGCYVDSVNEIVNAKVLSGLVFPSMSTFSNISKNESWVPTADHLRRSKKRSSETLYFLNPLNLLSCTTMLAGSPWRSHSCSCDSSATATGVENHLSQKCSPPFPPPPPPTAPPPEKEKRRMTVTEGAEEAARAMELRRGDGLWEAVLGLGGGGEEEEERRGRGKKSGGNLFDRGDGIREERRGAPGGVGEEEGVRRRRGEGRHLEGDPRKQTLSPRRIRS